MCPIPFRPGQSGAGRSSPGKGHGPGVCSKSGPTTASPLTGISRLFMILSLVSAIALIAACIKHSPRYEASPELVADKIETAENSLPIMVTDLSWSLINNGVHLRARGLVRNTSQQTYQSVTLYAQFLNENGESLGRGSSFITPSYLPPGKEGMFEITIMPARNKTVKYLNFISNAQVLY